MTNLRPGKLFLLCLIALTAFAFYIRTPCISAGLPYFYNEDEAHHFNRVLRMAKTGDMDPNYFHKPSLHFYLRIPVVWGTALYAKSKGLIADISEIQTRDPFGIGGYAFWAFPQIFAKSSRLLSILFSVGLVFLTGLLAHTISQRRDWALYSALLVAISPAQIEYSGVIGVDVLMAFMCLLATTLALKCYRNFSEKLLFITGSVCGLAVSSKYNAMPVGILPLAVCYLSGNLYRASFLIACITPLLGFLLGSPYILVHPDIFKSQLGYEVWHYAVAGHVGHQSTPGLSQAIFYTKWLVGAGLGFGAMLFAALGIYYSRILSNKTAQVVLLFPVLYFALMIAQKTNFERNMLVLVPYLAAISVYFFTREGCNKIGKVVTLVIAGCALLEPALKTETLLREISQKQESRLLAADWVSTHKDPQSDLAVAGELQFEPKVFDQPGTIRVNSTIVNPFNLYLAGIDRFLYPKHMVPKDLSYVAIEKNFEGTRGEMRVVDNPAIQIFKFKESPELTRELAKLAYPEITCRIGGLCKRLGDSSSTQEGYVWTERRREVMRVEVPSDMPINIAPDRKISVEFALMTPWANQSLTIETAGATKTLSLEDLAPGTWTSIAVEVPAENFAQRPEIIVWTKEIHSPKDWGLNADTRRLGIALKSVTYGDLQNSLPK